MTRSALAFLATGLALTMGCSSTEKSEYEPAQPTHVKGFIEEGAPAQEAPPAREAPVVVRETPPVKHDGLYWTERAYPTGDKRTSVILLESGTPAEVSAGTRYDYVLKVTNLSDLNLDNVVVMDKPEGNFQLHGSNPKTVDGRDLTWNIGSLRPKQVKEITVTGTALDEGHVTHCAEVDWRSLFCSTTQVVKPGLAITSTATAAVLTCDPITYNVTVTNAGTGTTRNVVIEDRLPDGVTTLDGKQSVQYTLPALEPGESKTFSWQAKAARSGRYTTAATARADGNLTARSGELVTTATKPALSITKTGTKETYMGRTVVYDMTIRNTGDGEARDVVVTDNLPAGAKFVMASEGGMMDGGAVRWKFGNMAPGAARTFSVKVSAANAGKLRSTATASAYCAETVTAVGETDVTGVPAILLEVVDLHDPVEVGETTTYMITATNQGSSPGTNIKIAVDLEDTMAYVSASGATKVDQTGKTVVFSPLASLAPGEKATWKVEVKAVGEGDVRIKVAMDSDQLTRSVEETEATNFFK